MGALDTVRDALPEAAKDIKLNLQSVLAESTLSPAQRWGVAVASAATARNRAVLDAVTADALAAVDAAVVDDALAAAALMAMNNVYYRFRHMVGDPVYAAKPARLRMNRLGRPATTRTDVELFSLAASAINGCEACVQAHEKIVRDAGITDDQVHDAVRIAAVIHAAAVALEITGVTTAAA
ncbi:MAG: carboxymuconolactone decarboxylase family protein [Candidatus Rokubacteria bacterium]|nr:carboxymuconolactone decarboxylase family protein [Candidatus Rokubacteria bacterium]